MNAQPIIRVENLYYTYPDGTEALQGVSMQHEAGKVGALIGPNGCGKSTLMLHLNGILTGKGLIEVLGLPVVRANFKKIRERVGIVFQNPDDQLFCATVFDDVAFGPRNQGLNSGEVTRLVHESLHAVGMSGFEERSAFHLSLGQKKRVALATVLATKPEILLLDEPTANLDPRGRREIINLMAAQAQTLLFITHDLLMVRELCHRVIVMDEGKIVCQGDTQTVLNDQQTLKVHGLVD